MRDRYDRWRLGEVLVRHPGLRIIPSVGDGVVLAGDISFYRQGPRFDPIDDTYAISMEVPAEFPRRVPMVKETGGRIPPDFHKLQGDYLCLGAPTELRFRLATAPTLVKVVDDFVVPYLFGYSYFVRHGEMPFGERSHHDKGILECLSELFGARTTPEAPEFVRLASMRRRDANKQACPCGSGKRLGRCHHRRVNHLRDRLGRPWFREEYRRIGVAVPDPPKSR